MPLENGNAEINDLLRLKDLISLSKTSHAIPPILNKATTIKDPFLPIQHYLRCSKVRIFLKSEPTLINFTLK